MTFRPLSPLTKCYTFSDPPPWSVRPTYFIDSPNTEEGNRKQTSRLSHVQIERNPERQKNAHTDK